MLVAANDNLGRRTSFARANGASASTTYGYDGMSRLASLVHNASGTANDVTFGYSYNPASQITGRTVSNALYKWGVPADFSDAYADNNLNQITSVDGAPFAHDARGNTTDEAAKTYAYDADNRMIASGTGVQAYDPLGRLYRLGSGTETRFLYSGSQIVAEYNQSNVLQRRFVPGGLDAPLVWLEGTGTGARKWLLADERGSVIAHADAAAAVTQINRYDPYDVPDAGNSGRFRYAGAPWIAAAGLYHMRARNYSPDRGRFMQADPILYAGGMNLYGYVGNDPVNFIDPWGLWLLKIGGNAGGTFVFGGGVSAGVYFGTRRDGSFTWGTFETLVSSVGAGADLSGGASFCPFCSTDDVAGESLTLSGKLIGGIEVSAALREDDSIDRSKWSIGFSYGRSAQLTFSHGRTFAQEFGSSRNKRARRARVTIVDISTYDPVFGWSSGIPRIPVLVGTSSISDVAGLEGACPIVCQK